MWHRTLVASVLAMIVVSAAAAAPTVQLRDQLTGLSSLNLDPAVPHQITVEIFIIPEAGSANRVAGAQTRLMCNTPGVSYEPAHVSGMNMLNYVQPYDQNVVSGTAYWGGYAGRYWVVPDPASWNGFSYTYPLLDENDSVTPSPGQELPTALLVSLRPATNNPHVFAWVTIDVPANAAYPITVYADPDPLVGTVLASPANGGTTLPTPNRIPLVLNAPEPATAVMLVVGLGLLRRRRP
jgi:hypothetical protein